VAFTFRRRVFATAALIVAAVLAAVIAVGWSGVTRFETERLDARLCMEARRVAVDPRHGRELGRLEADLLAKLRLDSADQVLVRHEPPGGGPGFRSSRWDDRVRLDESQWTTVPNTPGEDRSAGRAAVPECSFASFEFARSDWHAARFDSAQGRGTVAADLRAMRDELHGAVLRGLTLLVPIALALTALGAWVLAGVTMRPVNRLRRAMKDVSRKALDQRVPSGGEDREFGELIAAYNEMLDRLEASFNQATRFSADAAHELKTPLTILRGRLEQAVNRSERREIQGELTEMLDEVERLAAITRKLLLLSQADAGRLALRVERVDLTTMLEDRLADARLLAEDRQVEAGIAHGLVVDGDALLLGQLFNNLLSNAIRYGSPGGRIRIEACAAGDGVDVVFENAAPPITAAERARFFDRFWRGDDVRQRHPDSSGLGLSLAREIARAHGGELTLEPSAPEVVRLRCRLGRIAPGPVPEVRL
jgi:signal transduction histidine kinase